LGVLVHEKARRSPILWVCDDAQCLEIAKGTKHMRQDEFNRVENVAAIKGGDEAGAYLEQIGKTDMIKLTREEWGEFCRRLVAGYRKALKAQLAVFADGK